MNGLEINFPRDQDGLAIDRRPKITCAGEIEVFSSLEDNLTEALPQEKCEWRRTFGRPVRSVHVGATFLPYSLEALPKGNQWDLIRQPLFHIYFTDCMDIDVYKASIKEDVENWLKELNAKDINDWLIIVVESFDGKRSNKLLPRTTVLDKIRADFAAKQGDRCISVINPNKSESKQTDSWKGLVSRIRHLLLVAYAKAIYRLEEHVRQQREKRNEPGWNFMHYFALQEELAQILEMLGLYDEALVQYDELDALFSQFVTNGMTNESVCWLSDFQNPLDRWHGLNLKQSKLPESASLLELRAYIFAKQAHMLLLINKVWEMASRCLPFLHNCTRELAILEISAPTGAVSCWLFLAAMEVLDTCESFNHADEVEEYSLHTAGLWEYASQKVKYLGKLCGLMPGGSPTSEQLHIVVGLSAGMGDNPGTPTKPSPTDKLKEALCSQDAFYKTYLELAELAMGTYKHIGRLRSARLVGREVASFYMLLGESQKAAAFLGDVLRTFEQDGWHELAAQTNVELAECFRKAQDTKKFISSCASVAAALEIDTLIRWTYFDEMCKCLNLLREPLIVPFNDIIKIVSVSLINECPVMQDSNIIAELVIESNFPKEVLCTNFMISIETDNKKVPEKYCASNTLTNRDMRTQDPVMQRLRIKKNLDFKQDKQLASAGVASKFTELRRKDSSSIQFQAGDFSQCLEVSKLPVVLTPGLNVMRLNKQANYIGKYYLGQIAIHIKNVHLVSPALSPRLAFEIKEEAPTLKLYKKAAPLLSGIEQVMNVILTTGSYYVAPEASIKLIASPGLTIQVEPESGLVNTLDIEVGQNVPFCSTRRPLRVLADMMTKEHQVTIHVPWTTKPIVVSLNFAPPLTASWKLYTASHRKFVQVNVTGQCEKDLIVNSAKLNVGGVLDLVEKNYVPVQIISNGSTYSYIWELLVKADVESTIKAEFSLSYKLENQDDVTKLYQYFFDITDYQTLYTVDVEVEPASKGGEFCRAGAVCRLALVVERVCAAPAADRRAKSVMYEVLAEQGVWAVCGRTAGVVSFEPGERRHDVALDVMPLAGGHLPLPLVRLSKYVPGEAATAGDVSKKGDTHPRLEPFSPGQVYNKSKGKQLHVIVNANEGV